MIGRRLFSIVVLNVHTPSEQKRDVSKDSFVGIKADFPSFS